MKKKVCVLAFFVIFLLKPLIGIASESASVSLRVCVIDNKDEVHLVLKGPYKVYAVNSERILMEGPRLWANVRGTKTGIMIGKKDIAISGIKVKSYRDSDIYVNGRRLRGDIDIIRRDDMRLSVVNNIDMEYYLYGVLYHEVSHRWPMEVLKAQAITARTFASYQKMQNKPQPYDLRSDIYSQVYGGRTSEKWAATKAVDLTRGKVLSYGGRIFPAYYHATCAGYTEDASNLWNTDLAPLKGVPCDFCKRSPYYRWVKEMPLWEVSNKLKDNGYKIGHIALVTISSRNKSGRAEKLEIKDDSGTSVIMTAKDFRQLFGPNEVRSTKFDASIKWNQLALKGSGWGHGVGMCQWGAYGMAKKGKKAAEILAHYYPGSEITTIDKTTDKQ